MTREEAEALVVKHGTVMGASRASGITREKLCYALGKMKSGAQNARDHKAHSGEMQYQRTHAYEGAVRPCRRVDHPGHLAGQQATLQQPTDGIRGVLFVQRMTSHVGDIQ